MRSRALPKRSSRGNRARGLRIVVVDLRGEDLGARLAGEIAATAEASIIVASSPDRLSRESFSGRPAHSARAETPLFKDGVQTIRSQFSAPSVPSPARTVRGSNRETV